MPAGRFRLRQDHACPRADRAAVPGRGAGLVERILGVHQGAQGRSPWRPIERPLEPTAIEEGGVKKKILVKSRHELSRIDLKGLNVSAILRNRGIKAGFKHGLSSFVGQFLPMIIDGNKSSNRCGSNRSGKRVNR